jgi:hypothetical protein
MVVKGKNYVVFILGVVKINASFGEIKYEKGKRVLMEKEFNYRISKKI